MNSDDQTPEDGCGCSSDSCSTIPVARREFFKVTGLTAAMLAAGQATLMAGPFSKKDFDKIIPADKKLSKEWIASLYARGNPLTVTKPNLKYIGMPINGICTGQVYLGGDGRLWHWNLDASRDGKAKVQGPRFMDPDVAHSPMSQGFALQAGGKVFTLDGEGFEMVTFTNQYPMAKVDYSDPSCPVAVQLQAYTPFIPLSRDDSSYPVVVMRYTIENSSDSEQKVSLAGWVENVSNRRSGKKARGSKVALYRELDDMSAVECFARFGGSNADADTEVFADFERGSYGDWRIDGEAFGNVPSTGPDAAGVQVLSGVRGKGLVNSWNGTDTLQGKLISPDFVIEKPYINFLIGGGSDPKRLTASLWVNGKKVRSATGKKSDALKSVSWSVKDFKGQDAHFEILDASSGGWGHIDVDQIEFSTRPQAEGAASLQEKADFGSIALGVMGGERPEIVDIVRSQPDAAGVFAAKPAELVNGSLSTRDFSEDCFASLGRTITLKPGESQTLSFCLSWRFPNVQYSDGFGPKGVKVGANHYASLWPTAVESANAVALRESELRQMTQQWVETWYDSTLPYWFLERTFVTLDCVQTQMGQRLAANDDLPQHYNFDEGVKCCPGNCTHVWHYAQGLARVFPEIERECRDKVEYGLGFDPKSGAIRHRYSSAKFGDAIDGNCGTILRVLRESQMTTDYTFLESIWGRVKLSMDHVIKKWDPDEDGMLAGSQHNTLDEPWFGQVHWLINLYHAALKASAIMARQMNRPAVAKRYEGIVAKGAPAMVDLLWNQDFGYFIHKPGPTENQMHGSTNGCHIDQMLGDSWAWNVGIDRILPEDKIKQSLESLWTYNFTPNVGDLRKEMTNGRWYATEGNAGLIMCSFPNGKIEPKSGKKSYAGYLNECMTGFEWQVAAHMIWEGMVEKGLSIGKAIYDRYLPQDRNPYNEIECSDHYSRAMASYGAFTAICGYHYDGPEGKLRFGPRLTPENFRAGFTTAEGWGSFVQMVEQGQQSETIELRYGKLALKELAFEKVPGTRANQAKVKIDGEQVDAEFKVDADRYVVFSSRQGSVWKCDFCKDEVDMSNTNEQSQNDSADCSAGSCGCGPHDAGLARRNFLKLSAVGTTGLSFAGLPAMAGPFSKDDAGDGGTILEGRCRRSLNPCR